MEGDFIDGLDEFARRLAGTVDLGDRVIRVS